VLVLGLRKLTVYTVHDPLVVLSKMKQLIRIGKEFLLLGLGVWLWVVGYGTKDPYRGSNESRNLTSFWLYGWEDLDS